MNENWSEAKATRMKTLSSHMPEIPAYKMQPPHYVVLIVLLLGFGWLCCLIPFIGIMVVTLTFIASIMGFIERRRIRGIA
jgi:hypothetical protein